MKYLLLLFIIGCSEMTVPNPRFHVLRCPDDITGCILSDTVIFKTKKDCEDFIKVASETQKKVSRFCKEM